MRLTLAEPKYLKDSIIIISDLVNEVTFKINKEGIEAVAMDPANVAMVVLKLLSSAFTEYDVKEEIELAINLNNLKQVLRRAKSEDTVTIEKSENNKLVLQFKGNTTRTFSLPIIDLEEKEHKIPSLTFSATITTDSSLLNDAVEDVGIVGESVLFEVEKNKFNLIAEGDLNKAKIEIPAGDSTKISLEGQKLRSKYSIEYLKKMIAGSKIASDVTIKLSKDYPLKIEYKTIDKVALSFVLAPRVEND